MKPTALSLLALAALLALPTLALSNETNQSAVLSIGDAVVTGFSGVVEPAEEPPQGQSTLDETMLNPEGISARIIPLAAPGFRWDARVWPAETVRQFHARDVGQVFGVALDDAEFPNIYLTATSAYGLHIAEPDKDNDGRAERLKKGAPDAQWVDGMWGIVNANDTSGRLGGPGSIWKVDGRTGEVSLFANVAFKGQANGGAGLGNITFDAAHKQLFVSDLSTGMIHRFALDGHENEVFDAGVQAGDQGSVAYDPSTQLDITKSDFDTEDPETWGYTDENRRVWGLAVNGGRLYYAKVGQSQIWSVGIDETTGALLANARWELDVPKKPKKLPVSDILFTHQGEIILAQRAAPQSIYDYANFADPGKAHVYRFRMESPDDPNTTGVWIAEPEEYAVGFEPDYRGTDGGIALGQGYTAKGMIDRGACEASLWTTADNLRRNEELASALVKGGPMFIDGLQGMPTGPVKQYPPEKNNTPPWTSYMLDVDPANTDQSLETDDPLQWSDMTTQGWMGDVAVLRGCGNAIASAAGSTYGWPTEVPYWTDTVWSNSEGGGGQSCVLGVDCPPPPRPKACAKVVGEFTCDPKTGEYVFNGTLSAGDASHFDMVTFTNTAPGHAVVGGPTLTFSNPGTFSITGAVSSQTLGADLCLYSKADMESGKPYTCCKVSFDEVAPQQSCKKAQ